jgi:spore photoproduct lyase
VLGRFPNAEVVPCHHYGEVFNRRAQDFRLQKRKPALILARKQQHFVLPTPVGYGVGGDDNHYFSHMLNCVYDCRYCFLQGMFRSAYYVLFVNYEDFQAEIAEVAEKSPGESWFFSGYDCDSLAFEPITGFATDFLPFFREHPSAWLELRTKSVQVGALRETEPLANGVVAFSFTPDAIGRELERGVPSVERRIEVAADLQRRGWKLGLRFDPLLYTPGYRQDYTELFSAIFERLDATLIHSVSLGVFRLPKPYFERLYRLYPEEPLLAGPQEEHGGMVAFPVEMEAELLGFCRKELGRWVGETVLNLCTVPA